MSITQIKGEGGRAKGEVSRGKEGLKKGEMFSAVVH